MKIFFAIIVAGLTAMTIAWIVMSIAFISSPLGWIIVAIIVAVIALVFAILWLVKHWSTVWGFIKKIALDVWHWMVGAWNATWNAIKGVALSVWHWLVGAWNDVVGAFHDTVNFIMNYVVRPIVQAFTIYLLRPFMSVMNIIMKFWKVEWNIIVWVIKFAWAFISTVVKNIVNDLKVVFLPVIHQVETVWKAVWNAIGAAISATWNSVIKPTFNFLAWLWKTNWQAMVKTMQWAWGILKAIWGFIWTYGIKPFWNGLQLFANFWKGIWKGVTKQAGDAWGILKTIWGYIKRDGIDKLASAMGLFAKGWSKVWSGISSFFTGLWNKNIKPIFDAIGKAIGKVMQGFKDIAKAPGSLGKTLGNLLTLHFDQGGYVPGPPGAPVAAIVHGGEFVMSRDMLAGRTMTPIRTGSPSGGVGGAGGATIVVLPPDIYLDGKKVNQVNQTRAQRTKIRNTTSFMS